MRLMMPNPPLTGMPTRFEGVESIRINEVFAKPVIRLEAEEALEQVVYNPATPNVPPTIVPARGRFEVLSGNTDDGWVNSTEYDSNWGPAVTPVQGSVSSTMLPGYHFLPQGFRNTFNPALPIANMDILAPAFIFSVTNTQPPRPPVGAVGSAAVEAARWTFTDIPNGVYDVVLYMHPKDRWLPEVSYTFNGRTIPMMSEEAIYENYGAPQFNVAHRVVGQRPENGGFRPMPLGYRLLAFGPGGPPDPEDFTAGNPMRVVVDNNELTVDIVLDISQNQTDSYLVTSFDRIELINQSIQYVELVNLSPFDIDLTGFTVNTPYGHYVITDDDVTPVIKRMKPAGDNDDGNDLTQGEGLQGDGVPYEPLLTMENINRLGSTLTAEQRRLEDNKLLLAFNKNALVSYVQENFPTVENINDRIIGLQLPDSEVQRMMNAIANPNPNQKYYRAQVSDKYFRLVDVQDDILSHNPQDKYVSLHDPAGNYIDSFKYRTTFNNVIVNIPGNDRSVPNFNQGLVNEYDLLAAPGYRGFEVFERADPTHFETEMRTVAYGSSGVSNPYDSGNTYPNYRVEGARSVPSSIKLYTKDAILTQINFEADDNRMERVAFGGYETGNDRNNPGFQRFKDPADPLFGAGFTDSLWNGWDFIGDHYQYPRDYDNPRVQLWYENNAMAREAALPTALDDDQFYPASQVSKTKFYQMLGGFENFKNINTPQLLQAAEQQFTAFTWRVGLRELIRAGYDPDVDDQLTVRVLGRKYVNHDGQMMDIDLPVGEVLVIPSIIPTDPGSGLDSQRIPITRGEIEGRPNPLNIYRFGGNVVPIFAKLRNGDTAFTINLREQYSALYNDLQGNSQAEPQLEIMVIMRKTTFDISPDMAPQISAQGVINFQVMQIFRPDLLQLFPGGTPQQQMRLLPQLGGYYFDGSGRFLGSMGDDNYFFKGIELFGRGRLRSKTDSQLQFLAGTPLRDNTGYVPAYPRRRMMLAGTTRDESDIIDNTAYVKNGPLATLGEISRLFTGNRFETVNTPLIPQWLEDRTLSTGGIVENNPEIMRNTRGNDLMRIVLAQRERLDQWENQYNQLYNMITTANSGIVPGLINVNTAPREVLAALPFAPPLSPGVPDSLENRFNFNSVVADFIMEGRRPVGHDGYYGVHELDDDRFLADYLRNIRTPLDTVSDYKLPTVGREPQFFKRMNDIASRVFSPLNIESRDVRDRTVTLTEMNATAIVSEPDDGPYTDLAMLLSQITHLKRRDRFAKELQRQIDRTNDTKPDGIGDLRERLNEEPRLSLREDLTPEDMEAMMNRISNLVTVRSRAFQIITRGQVFDRDFNITAQRKIETVYER
jgi:hypothetical protein